MMEAFHLAQCYLPKDEKEGRRVDTLSAKS